MAADKQFLFVSYARQDFDRVRPIVDAVRSELEKRALPVELWMDMSHLIPGEQWNEAIAGALELSIGFLFFVSPNSLRSAWVRQELGVAASAPDRLIIPVILYEPALAEMPDALARRQWLDLSGHITRKDIANAASRIAEATATFLRAAQKPRAVISKAEVPELAAEIAQQVRGAEETVTADVDRKSVFVVHGHNQEALAKLEEYLSSVGIEAVLLSRQDESPQSLFQKFMSVATKARFAIVLLCADDYGASRKQYDADGVADRALQFRARQNVILELGFFYGRLGWERVFVVHQEPDRVFPNFERPSDLDGIVFDKMADPDWQRKLSERLRKAEFKLTRSA